MKPKKRSSSSKYVIATITLVVVVFVSLHIGMVLMEKAVFESSQGTSLSGLENITKILDMLENRISNTPFLFAPNDYVTKSVLWGALVWFIVIAYLFTGKKKYIAGKEYGTAEWGAQNDIRDLFAVNLMKKEIKQAKRVRTPTGRHFEKKKAYASCKKNSLEIMAMEIDRLEDWKNEAIRQGDKRDRQNKKRLIKESKSRKKEIHERAARRTEAAFVEAWKPNKIKKQFDDDMEEIARLHTQRLAITNEDERRRAEAKARTRYDNALKTFYSGKGEVEKIRKKYENADALFTKTERICIFNFTLNNNTLILGGSGSGKTRGFVMPNILQAHSSFVITDPKGEILEKAGYFLETVKGYKIRVLNLDVKTKSDGYNPFVYIHPEQSGYEERVLTLIEAIILNTDGGEKRNSSDPFWDKAERLFLQAIFFFTCDGFVFEEQNMNTVLDLIGMLQIGEEEDSMESDLDYFAKFFAEKNGDEHIGVQQYKEFREKASGKTAKSIVISAVVRLAPFRTSAIRRMFNYDTMALDRLGEEKTAVFVVVPPTDTTFNFIAGMLFTQMFQELQYCATQVHKHDGQRLPVPVRFILDEFANTCTIPNFVKILAYARSFGIGIVPVLQSLEQLKKMYKDEWGVIIDNCNTLLYLGGISHMDTLEYMSKLLGKGTYDKKSSGRTRGKSGSSSQNFDVIGRELMDTAEIRKLPKQNCLFIVGGKNPFYSEKYDYVTHPNYKYTSDNNKSYSFEYAPPDAVAVMRDVSPEAVNDEDDKQRRVADRVAAIMNSVDTAADEIQMSFNPKSQVIRMGKTFNYLVPIRDELLEVPDGSEPECDSDALLLEMAVDDDDTRDDERRTVDDGYRVSALPVEADSVVDDLVMDADQEGGDKTEDDFGDLGGMIDGVGLSQF